MERLPNACGAKATHTFVLDIRTTLRRWHRCTCTNGFSLDAARFFFFFEPISAALLPPDRLTRLFIFPMPTLNSNNPPQPPPTEKAYVCLARSTKKVGKYQQVVIYIRTKTNKPRRKELLRRSKAFFFAPEILLMWLQAACQPNLIWIYIQRKCLV